MNTNLALDVYENAIFNTADINHKYQKDKALKRRKNKARAKAIAKKKAKQGYSLYYEVKEKRVPVGKKSYVLQPERQLPVLKPIFVYDPVLGREVTKLVRNGYKTVPEIVKTYTIYGYEQLDKPYVKRFSGSRKKFWKRYVAKLNRKDNFDLSAANEVEMGDDNICDISDYRVTREKGLYNKNFNIAWHLY